MKINLTRVEKAIQVIQGLTKNPLNIEELDFDKVSGLLSYSGRFMNEAGKAINFHDIDIIYLGLRVNRVVSPEATEAYMESPQVLLFPVKEKGKAFQGKVYAYPILPCEVESVRVLRNNLKRVNYEPGDAMEIWAEGLKILEKKDLEIAASKIQENTKYSLFEAAFLMFNWGRQEAPKYFEKALDLGLDDPQALEYVNLLIESKELKLNKPYQSLVEV